MIKQRKVILDSEITEIDTRIKHRVEICSGIAKFNKESDLNGPVYQLVCYKRDVIGVWTPYINNVNADRDVIIEYYKSVLYKLLH